MLMLCKSMPPVLIIGGQERGWWGVFLFVLLTGVIFVVRIVC